VEQAETRFRLLETIRQYARDKLLETGAAAMARDRHLSYYLKFAEAGEPNIYGPQRLEWIDRCEMEHDNFRAALQWGLDHEIEAAMRLGGALATFWGARGFILEGHRWLQAALDRPAALPEPDGEALRQRQAARAKGLMGISQMSYGSGDYRSGLDASQEALRLYRELGDWFNIGFALGYIGNMAAFQNDMVLAEQALTEAILVGREHKDKLILDFALGVMSRYVYLPRGDVEKARDSAEESGRFSRELGLSWGVAQTELILARIAAIYGQWDEARKHALAAVEVYQELRDPLLLNMSYCELGDIELRAGNLAEARRHLQNCILVFQELGQQAFVAHELESFAYIERSQNQPVRVACLLGAAEAVLEGIGTSAVGVERLEDEYQKTVDWLHAQMNETAYEACWSEGCAMTMDQAISYALME
jgi:tetratricopeptide (TPR) repeat protein